MTSLVAQRPLRRSRDRARPPVRRRRCGRQPAHDPAPGGRSADHVADDQASAVRPRDLRLPDLLRAGAVPQRPADRTATRRDPRHLVDRRHPASRARAPAARVAPAGGGSGDRVHDVGRHLHGLGPRPRSRDLPEPTPDPRDDPPLRHLLGHPYRGGSARRDLGLRQRGVRVVDPRDDRGNHGRGSTRGRDPRPELPRRAHRRRVRARRIPADVRVEPGAARRPRALSLRLRDRPSSRRSRAEGWSDSLPR